MDYFSHIDVDLTLSYLEPQYKSWLMGDRWLTCLTLVSDTLLSVRLHNQSWRHGLAMESVYSFLGTWAQFLVPTSGGSQLPITPTAEGSDSRDFHKHQCTHTYIYNHKNCKFCVFLCTSVKFYLFNKIKIHEVIKNPEKLVFLFNVWLKEIENVQFR